MRALWLQLRSARPLFEAAGNGEAPPARGVTAAALQKRTAFLLYFGTEKASTPQTRNQHLFVKPQLHFSTSYKLILVSRGPFSATKVGYRSPLFTHQQGMPMDVRRRSSEQRATSTL
jgi:hypothetical protein